jgi:glycosyltransferase involved in cell wall biosynthesis
MPERAKIVKESPSHLSRKLRILTIGHSYCVALNRAIFREVARDEDFDVTLAAPTYFYGDLRPITLEPEPPDSPLHMVPLKTRATRVVHVFSYENRALKRLLRDGRFDIVHAWEEPYILAGFQIARALRNDRAKFCFWTAQSYVKRYPPPFGYFEKRVLARAQSWAAQAGLVYDAMLKHGYPRETARTITLAVDLDAFAPLAHHVRATVRNELGLRGPVIGFVGRLVQEKGLDVLMRALEKLNPETPWSLLLLGSGDYHDKILNWAKHRGWSERVKIKLVNHADVPRYIGAMDMLVAPSQSAKNWREQFGRMLVEAFACGVPVIGSDSGEIPFVIGDAGKVVPEADVAAWTNAIQELLTNPDLRANLAKRGLERANKYSVRSIAAQYRDYFRWLADRT